MFDNQTTRTMSAATTYLFGPINDSHEAIYDVSTERRFRGGGPSPIVSPSPPVEIIYPYLSWSTFWFAMLCVFVAFNTKNMPFMWHLRLVNAFRHIIRTCRPRVAPRPEHLFQPLITSSQAELMEIDCNMHKTNSSYFSDTDVARAHLVCTLFGRGIAEIRGGTAAYTGTKQPAFNLALGAVTCSFRRELRPYEKYEMWSKILTWDEKWVYIVTHFVKKGAAQPKSYSLYPQQKRSEEDDLSDEDEEQVGGDYTAATSQAAADPTSPPPRQIYATALSKCVFKAGRKTVKPELMFEMSGYMPSEKDYSCSEKANTDATLDTPPMMTRAEMEAQRKRGMELARILASQQNQQGLEDEFGGEGCEALGRHTDGSGLAPVVGTLMQLAHLDPRSTPIL